MPANKPEPRPRSRPDGARFAYDGLARLLHEKARLSILASLAAHEDGVVFNDLKALCALTDGNLSRQLQILREAGIVEISKGQSNNRPQTRVRLTDDGRERFMHYIGVLESVVTDALAASSRSPNAGSLEGPTTT